MVFAAFLRHFENLIFFEQWNFWRNKSKFLNHWRLKWCCCKRRFHKCIQNPVRHLRWSFQPLTILAKRFIVDVWLDSEFVSGFGWSGQTGIGFPNFWYYWNGLIWLKFSSFRGRTKISSCRTINHLHRITENLMFCFSPGTMPTRNYKLRPFLFSIYEFSSNNSLDLKLKIKDRKHLTLQPMVYERYN